MAHSKKVPPFCRWTEDGEACWDTDCDHKFVLTTDDGPVAHLMKFCCFCGKPLKERRYAGDR